MGRPVYKVKLDQESLQEEKRKVSESMQKGGDLIPYFKPKVGNNRIRIIPSLTDNQYDYCIEKWVHYKVGPKNRAVNCLEQYGEECPICESLKSLKNSDNNADKEEYSDKKAKACNISLIFDRDENDKIKIYSLQKTVYANIVSLLASPETKHMLDWDNGFDIIVERIGTKRDDTKYIVKAARSDSKASDDESIFDRPDALTAIFPRYTYDEVISIMDGTFSEKSKDKSEAQNEETAEDFSECFGNFLETDEYCKNNVCKMRKECRLKTDGTVEEETNKRSETRSSRRTRGEK